MSNIETTDFNRDYKNLELDKILDMLSGETTFKDAADFAKEIRPSHHLTEVKTLLDETFSALNLISNFGAPTFGSVQNIHVAVKRAVVGACLSTRELLNVADVLNVLRSLKDWRRRCVGITTVIDEHFDMLVPNRTLEESITSKIISEDEIDDNASRELANIRRKIKSMSARARDQLNKMVHSPTYQKFLQEPVITIRDGRFVLPVKTESRGNVAGLVHDSSSSGATVFIEPIAVVEANNQIRLLKADEQTEIERILMILSDEVASFSDNLIFGFSEIVLLNVIFAKAKLAFKMKASMPKLNKSGYTLFKNARHPLIDEKHVVPINIELGGIFDTLVITGPNTGGKTVSLKTVGLLTLMTMCGLMPPCGDGSTVSVYEKILSDIGDEQSIEQSLSTFSSHMVNLTRIIKEADENTLVLTDELGAGTDPIEGAALAIAILDYLRNRGAKIVATTHYSELKVYALNTIGVENASCEFDIESLRPTYRLIIGIPGRSNAFAISSKLGVPDSIIEKANQLISSEERGLEQVVSSLEERRTTMEFELKLAEEKRIQAEHSQNEANNKLAKLENLREKRIDEANEQAKYIISQARAKSEQLMRELDEIRKKKNTWSANEADKSKREIRAALRDTESIFDTASSKPATVYKLPRPLKVGDIVMIVDIDKSGTVLSAADMSGNVVLQAGIVKTSIHVSRLRLMEDFLHTTKKTSGFAVTRPKTSAPTRTELDLRGQNSEEALMNVDQFIDDASRNKLEQVTLIHGKGTGVLRASVQRHLRSNSQVKTFRLGQFGEGEDGVTIVFLK